MSDPAIKVSGLSKTFRLPHEKNTSIKSSLISFFGGRRGYETQQALKAIDFEIKKGEFFGIVGRNGSGKSTLLKLLAGIYTPDQGEIKINGSITPFIELGVGFNQELSGRENVFLNGALLGFNRKQMRAMYDDIVAFAELERFMDQTLKNYSSGMQVRLAFSIAIRARGDILLLDEVLAVGDSAFQRKCLEFFREIKKTGRTVVLVTHNMATIEEYCDRAMMLQDSKIVSIGSPMKISLEYEMANSSTKKLGLKKRLPENKMVVIKNVTIHSQKEEKQDFGLTDDLIVSALVDVRKKITFQVSIALYNMDGEYISGVSSKKDLPKFTPNKGLHKISCVVNAGQFAKGAYKLVFNVSTDTERPEPIDVASSDYGVDVPPITFNQKAFNKNGKFYMSAKWQLDE